MKIINKYKNSHIDISEINELVKNPQMFIARCEKDYYHQIDRVVERVLDSRGRIRVILLAGPSSSGKTTTANKLSEEFFKIGINAPVVSLDDFFLGKENYPKLPDGSPDMEALEALDLPLINKLVKELMETGEAVFPTFDFAISRRSDVTHTVTLGEGGVLILEGLHAINPRLLDSISDNKIFRLFVSVRTKYLDDEKEVLVPKDVRLIRRMVRDHKFRNQSPLETLLGWRDVLDGEEKYIYPYRDSVDFKIDSALDYEACVFHHYILPMLESLKDDAVYSGKVKQVVDILEAFDDIDYTYIPKNSLLREFIGE
ncbi:MAG: hypothetical protein J6A76_04195 [Oscillospiraceae bacterium]|nr:hypothetical protein [Oscillospiraceae bacterium]